MILFIQYKDIFHHVRSDAGIISGKSILLQKQIFL